MTGQMHTVAKGAEIGSNAELQCSIAAVNQMNCAVSSFVRVDATICAKSSLECEIESPGELSCDLSIGGGSSQPQPEYIDSYILVLPDGTQLRAAVVEPE